MSIPYHGIRRIESKTLFNHVMYIWFNTELERIWHLGLVKEDYQQEKLQAILSHWSEQCRL